MIAFDTLETTDTKQLEPYEDLDDGVQYIPLKYNFTTAFRIRRQLTKKSIVGEKRKRQTKICKQPTSVKKTVVSQHSQHSMTTPVALTPPQATRPKSISAQPLNVPMPPPTTSQIPQHGKKFAKAFFI